MPHQEVRLHMSMNEIVTGVTSNSHPPRKQIPRTLSLNDQSQFPGTDDERCKVKKLFNQHCVVFAQSDNDLGCTSAVQY